MKNSPLTPRRMGAILLVIPGILGTRLAWSALSAAPTPTARAAEYADVTGDIGSRRSTPAGTLWTGTGHVIIKYKEGTLHTDTATFNEDTQVAVAPGRVQFDDPQNTLTGDNGIAYLKKRLAEVTGHVHIIARPKPVDAKAPSGSLRRSFKEPALMDCQRGSYNWRTKIANAEGNVVITFKAQKKNWTVTTDRAIYDGKAEKITLPNPLHATTAEGDDLVGGSADIGLKDSDPLNIKKIQHLHIKVDEDDTGEPASGAAATSASPAPAAPTGPLPPAPVTPGQ